MSNWSQNHDLVYAFVCVSFLADGEVDEAEKEAMRGNCKVMAPDMSDDDYNRTEAEVMKCMDNLIDDDITIILIAHRISTLVNCDAVYEVSHSNIKTVDLK